MADGVERRLAAIVVIDVAGYSRLMADDEAGTLTRLKGHRAAIVPLVERHSGRIVGQAGDGFLLEYPSVVEAVGSAVEIQEVIGERNAGLPDEQAMRFRIGVNLGDVIVDGADIFGDGINVAARLEALARPGGIAVSEAVREHVLGKLDAEFADAGTHEVKNIARPIRVWRWPAAAPAPVADSSDAPLALPGKPSVAVLPFDNMSADADQEYFSDGISEDIITALSRVRALFVIARNSTFAYKGAAVDVTRIAKELGVRYIVEGSVRKVGARVRITAQLIDGLTGRHVWADRYDRDLTDIFALQDEITETIVGRVASEVALSEMERARRKAPTDLETWDLYQLGRWYLQKFTRESNAKARELFRQCIARDPNFADAHADYGWTCYVEAIQGFSEDVRARIDECRAACERALSLDTARMAGRQMLGRSLALLGDGERAIGELQAAVGADPSNPGCWFSLGLTLVQYGRAADAVDAFDAAMRLSPRDPVLWGMQFNKAAAFNSQGNFVEAEAWARQSANARPEQFWPRLALAQALVGQGRAEDARTEVAAARRAKPDLSVAAIRRMLGHFHPPYMEPFLAALRAAGMPD